VGLATSDVGWAIRLADGPDITASVVVDATGRATRLPRWLADIGVLAPEPLQVDARLGYATRLIAGGPSPRDLPGVVVQATPQSPVGGIALPVEGRRWLVGAVGFGAHRPPRDPDGLAAFLDALPDPSLSALLHSGEPVGDVAVHRQTGNRRHRYAQVRTWPEGLLAIGDALCCFDPVYGQGITVSACQALQLRTAVASGFRAGTTRRLLRDFDRVVDFPWAVAIGQDLRMPSSSGHQSWVQAAVSGWASELGRRAVRGDRRAQRVLLRTYHLEGSSAALLHPALIASVAVGRLQRGPVATPRPKALDVIAA
jgi:flavin-dependent dehydrogenase